MTVIFATLIASSVSALTFFVPDTTLTATGNNFYVEVSRAGNGNALDAPVVYFKFFTTDPTTHIRIRDADWCHKGTFGGPDTNTIAPTKYEVFWTDEETIVNGTAENIFHPFHKMGEYNAKTYFAGDTPPDGNCGTDAAQAYINLDFENPTYGSQVPATKSFVPGRTNYYVGIVKVQHTGAADSGGVNAFRIAMENTTDRIGYWALNEIASSNSIPKDPSDTTAPIDDLRAFAIQDRLSGDDTYADYTLQFQMPCNKAVNENATLKWEDADQGESNQGRTLKFSLYERAWGGSWSVVPGLDNYTPSGGNGAYEFVDFTAKPNYQYEWRWYDVDKQNGIQIWVPYDSINFFFNCGEIIVDIPEYDLELSAPGTSTGAPGQPITSNFYITNVGTGPTPLPEGSYDFLIERSNLYLQGAAKTWQGDNDSFGIPPFIDSGAPPRPVNVPWTIPISAQVGDVWCVALRLAPPTGLSDGSDFNASATPIEAEHCVKIVNQPFVSVWNNSIWAGGGFQDGVTCDMSASAEFGKVTGVQRNSYGAVTEYAAFAQMGLTLFGSSAEVLANNLTFANNPTNGNFNAQRCLSGLFDTAGVGGDIDDELWQSVPAANTIDSNFNSFGTNDGLYSIAGSATYNNSKLQDWTDNATILINGDLYLRKPVTYAGTFPADEPPALVFIVSGNIYIQKDVEELDGIYIAKGFIDTCGNFSGSTINPITQLYTGSEDGCDKHLEIGGSFIAENIRFRRTKGGLNEANTGNLGRCHDLVGFYDIGNLTQKRNKSCAAETFIFDPGVYLRELYFTDQGAPDANSLKIQLMRELPPIF